MSYRNILSKHFGNPQTLSNSNIHGSRELLIKGSKKKSPKPFRSDGQSRRDLFVLIRGFLLPFFALVLLVICLWTFSKMQPLSKWEQRLFNTLSILLSATASLGLGSLLGHLGSMLRWPLLARTVYQMQDVDSILGMSPPTGSLRLIKRHIREWRISRTTFIVTAYLLTNVIGRLSVAIFGLAYNMTDKTGIDFRIGDDISPNLLSDLQMSNTTLKVDTNIVEYTYELKDFKEGFSRPSNHIVHSTVNCSIIEVDDDQYWRWNKGNRTGPFDWGKDNKEVVPQILGAANFTRDYLYTKGYWMSFLNISNPNNVSPQIYIVCEHVAWECWPALTETLGDTESHQIEPHEKFFHPTDLYRLLTVGNGDYVTLKDGYAVYLSGFSRSPKAVDPADGVSSLCGPGLFSSPNETIWNGYRLWVAGLVARLPILAIMHANTELPQYARGPHPNQTVGIPYLHTTLEVHWHRVALTAASITVGEILAILVVLYYCNGVYTRDDSHLAAAELLKTVINKFDDGKLMTGEELAASLDDVLKAPVSYGTRKGQDDDLPEVDLASGLEAKFPLFPQKQQFQRNTI
ncbi:hypothetical protein HOY80DRAFT_1105449 [Tuber brumale]|nr:hypothetical protein HOY80DRAFT_1105449 [Tuber brumale]